jgi:hypothetical protein
LKYKNKNRAQQQQAAFQNKKEKKMKGSLFRADWNLYQKK